MLLKNHSYSERANWVELLTGIGVLSYYLNKIRFLPGGFESHPTEFGILLIKVIVASIVLAIIYSVVFGLGEESESSKEDERDISIRRKATTWAYWIMNAGIIYLIVQLFINKAALIYTETDLTNIAPSIMSEPPFISVPSIDFMLHGLIILGFITQIAQNLIEICFQRRGF